jgi:hypothetical protein
MTVFSRLGLEESATEAEIKRAYARLLKINRPDGDPVAFQQLQEAYNACLQRVRYRQMPTESIPVIARVERDPIPEAGSAKAEMPVVVQPFAQPFSQPVAAPDAGAVPPAPRAFDVAEFFEPFAQKLLAGEARALDRWLHGLEPLYSLQLKQSLRPLVAQFLAEMERPPSPASLEVALSFFGLDQLSGGYLARHVAQAMQRSEAAESFDRSWRSHTSWHKPLIDRMLMQELKGPLSSWRRLFLLLMPQLPGRLGRLAEHFVQLDPLQARALLDEGSMRFWRQASNRSEVTRPRVVLAALRIPVYALGLALLINLLTGPPIQLPLFLPMLAWFSGLWLAYAGGLVGFAKLGRWMARKWEWDRPIQVTATLATLALVSFPFSRVIALLLFFPALLVWISGRGTSAAGLAAMISGIVLWSILLAPLLLDIDWILVLVCMSVLATLIGQDIAYAYRKRVPLFLVRRDRAWMGRLAVCNVAVLALYWLVKAN